VNAAGREEVPMTLTYDLGIAAPYIHVNATENGDVHDR